MDCCSVNGLNKIFNKSKARKESKAYWNKGLGKRAGKLADFVSSQDLSEATVLDIGCGIGSLHLELLTGIPQIKPTFLDIAPSGIPSNIIPHSKGVKCGLIRSNSPFSYSNHRPAKPKIPKPLVYAQVSPLGTSFATP